MWPRNVAKNLSGSKESRTAIFDLHCLDDMGNLIEIEVQIDVKPTYVVAITRHRTFDDDRIVHRATLTDLEYHKVWDHNALRDGFFEEFADDVNAKVEDRAREIAKRMLAGGKLTDEEIAAYSGLSIEDVIVLRSQADT